MDNYPPDLLVPFISSTQEFASASLENLSCKVGVLTLSEAFDSTAFSIKGILLLALQALFTLTGKLKNNDDDRK